MNKKCNNNRLYKQETPSIKFKYISYKLDDIYACTRLRMLKKTLVTLLSIKKVIDFSQYYLHCISISITNNFLVRCTWKPYQETWRKRKAIRTTSYILVFQIINAKISRNFISIIDLMFHFQNNITKLGKQHLL